MFRRLLRAAVDNGRTGWSGPVSPGLSNGNNWSWIPSTAALCSFVRFALMCEGAARPTGTAFTSSARGSNLPPHYTYIHTTTKRGRACASTGDRRTLHRSNPTRAKQKSQAKIDRGEMVFFAARRMSRKSESNDASSTYVHETARSPRTRASCFRLLRRRRANGSSRGARRCPHTRARGQ
jgi:hypothetical protein